ncbi:MAG: serine dehydratase subunit alpha family protein [Oscillospiraceae bacterium]|nr:serine dehydratase subunit alpha family protein [Oscillospiraceae bacterium]
MLTKETYLEYINILEDELVPAMGCTEPIALAYGAAKCREVLGAVPERIEAHCSGNIIKNVRCVTIPHSHGLCGIEAAVILGAVGGDCSRSLEVLTSIKEDDVILTQKLLNEGACKVSLLDSHHALHFVLKFFKEDDWAEVEIKSSHTNITKIIKNGEVLWDINITSDKKNLDYLKLNLDDIFEFANTFEINDLKGLLDTQIKCNMAIAEEGLMGGYGVGIGKMIRLAYSKGVLTEMKAYAASASEARMGGCELPVVVNSGSGNQGIAASVPVIVYVRYLGLSEEKLYRGLAFSNLLTAFQKMYIGKLSAFCGAVSAACAAGTALTYLDGGNMTQIQNTIENTLANIPGIICDGAKVSCAAKISSALDAAYLAHRMAMQNQAYKAFTGILQESADETISCVGSIGKDGMKETDKEILRIMLGGKS